MHVTHKLLTCWQWFSPVAFWIMSPSCQALEESQLAALLILLSGCLNPGVSLLSSHRLLRPQVFARETPGWKNVWRCWRWPWRQPQMERWTDTSSKSMPVFNLLSNDGLICSSRSFLHSHLTNCSLIGSVKFNKRSRCAVESKARCWILMLCIRRQNLALLRLYGYSLYIFIDFVYPVFNTLPAVPPLWPASMFHHKNY